MRTHPASIPGIALALAAALFVVSCGGRNPNQSEVVVYSSVDEVFARPISERFEQETGIRVLLVPDTEETKSTGLLNRLIAEKDRPRADVFWSGDPVRAAILKTKGVTAPYHSPSAEGLPSEFGDPEGHWSGFSARARVLIYNTDEVSEDEKPASIFALLEERFRGKTCMANPLFGTTSMHAAALFQSLGDEKAREFFDGFIANGGTIVSSNGEVRRRVAAGDFAFGITDTDDYNVAQIEGKSVGVVYPDQEGLGTLIIPNAAVLVAGGPNATAGRQFIDYLLSAPTELALAESEAAQMPIRPGIQTPPQVVPLASFRHMDVDYSKLAGTLERLAEGYLREWVAENAP